MFALNFNKIWKGINIEEERSKIQRGKKSNKQRVA